MHRYRLTTLLLALVVVVVVAAPGPETARAHVLYLANDNHTDYGWNATTDAYEASMLSELDYYLGQIAATAGNPPAEQARFNADCWYYLYLYEKHRTPAQFLNLLSRIQDGHITVPLNPFVTLYGALPTEAAIRAGYYPGRIERQYGVNFAVGQQMENDTIPWGLASVWAGSRVKYSWKGICACADQAPYWHRTEEVFRWQGPDGRELLMKWYQLSGSNASWGGYAEARNNLSQSAIQTAIDRFGGRPPFLNFTGLFGGGWDDVTYQTTVFVDLARTWNVAHAGGDQVVVSNIVDYFQALESSGASLPVLRGGWGNDWDLLPVSLAERTAQTRRAIEQLRTAEALAAVVHWNDATFWAPRQAALEAGLVDYFKYFEHIWVDGGLGMSAIIANKKTWAQSIDTAVTEATAAAATSTAQVFTTPAGEDRFVVFNPLAFARTDYADVPIATGSGPYVVTDVATATAVPSQVVTLDGQDSLRILASTVPSLGYRVYRYVLGTPAPLSDAASVSGNQIESGVYRVTLGARGELTDAYDKAVGQQMVTSASALNDFGSGSGCAAVSENAGPVSVTLRCSVTGTPTRRVRLTLVRDVDRVEIADEILDNYAALGLYRFDVNLAAPQIRFEEIGAIARPGLAAQGGDFLAGARVDYMSLNHFVNLAGPNYTVTISNWDALAMQVGNSSVTSFDLPTSVVSVLVTGNVAYSGIGTQGGDTHFLHRFALRGESGGYDGAAAMRMSLAHQNPLRAIALPRNQAGALTEPTASLLAVSAPNVVVTAFKPAEDGSRGLIVRLWELAGTATTFTIDASAFAPTTAQEVSLIETDVAPASVSDGSIAASIGANEIKAYRFTPSGLGDASACGDANGNDNLTVTDGVLALRAAAGLSSACTAPTCDVNDSGSVTVTDGVVILRAAAGLPADLRCP